ncbi:MAG: zinc-binding dehydrogenase [Nitrososphaerota archaeon]
MKAAVFYGPGSVKVVERDKPEPGQGEVVVKNVVALSCGTDLKMFMRGHPKAKPPVVMGHEFSGVVESIGDGVNLVKHGDRVVAVNSAPCGHCVYCKLGNPNLCENLDESILGFGIDGAYAEYVKLPQRVASFNLYKIKDGVEYLEAAMLEPLSCVVRAHRLVHIDVGDAVAVIGSGPIGLFHIMLSGLRGAGKVVAIDVVEERLDFAARLGADITINASKEDAVQRVKDLTDGLGADVVVEAVGRTDTWERSLNLARKGGSVILFGGCPSGTSANFDTYKVHYGELTVVGSFHHTPQDVIRALRLIESKKLRLRDLVTGEVKLDNILDVFHRLKEGKDIKIAIRF